MQETSTLQQVSPAQTQETSKPDQRNKKYDKPHMIIPDEDMEWALEQRSPVFKLWGQCWRSDPYGSRWMPLNTTLGRENLKKAKRPLIDSGLFLFENRLTVVNGKRIYEWWVKNLHGCRSIYWKFKKGVQVGEAGTDDTDVGNTPPDQSAEVGAGNTEPGAGNTEPGAGNTEPGAGNTEPGAGNTKVGTINTPQPYLNVLLERVSKALINVSVTSHKHFINSLTINERENFLKFCLQKIAALQATGFEVHTNHAWIASHYEQYWNEFETPKAPATGGKKTRKSLTDWRDHPDYDHWLYEAYTRGFEWANEAATKEERIERGRFIEWCEDNNAFSALKGGDGNAASTAT